MKRHREGQHFLRSDKTAGLIVDAARLTGCEKVLEVGTGRGELTGLLCEKAACVVSVESDAILYEEASVLLGRMKNLHLIYGDGFDTECKFDVFVSSLPYSQSRRAIEWLMQRDYNRAVIMVQKEFAEKLTAVLPEKRKALSVLAGGSMRIRQIAQVDRGDFEPPPRVGSVILEITRVRTLTQRLIGTVNRMFAYRRKRVCNILYQMGAESGDQRRLAELSGQEILKIAGRICAH